MSPSDSAPATSSAKLRSRQHDLLNNDFKPLIPFFNDPEITGIAINTNGTCWLKPMGKEWFFTQLRFEDRDVRRMILSAAAYSDIVISAENPILEGVLPDWDARIEGVLPPRGLSCSLTIRIPPRKIFTLQDYIAGGRLSQSHYDAIARMLQEKKTIIVGGGTGSGKTTFLNALIHELSSYCPSDRLIIVEDTPEIQCFALNYNSYVFPPDNSGEALRVALRSEPSRIIYGELRYGTTTFAALDAFNSGHPGSFTTIHANSAHDMLYRMKNLLATVTVGQVDLSLISRACNCCVFLQKTPGLGPQVTQVIEVHPEFASDGTFQYTNIL